MNWLSKQSLFNWHGLTWTSLLLGLALSLSGCSGGDGKTEGKTDAKTGEAKTGAAQTSPSGSGGAGSSGTTLAFPEYCRYFPEDALLAFVVRPTKILESEVLRSLPTEEFVNRAKIEMGLDPTTIVQAAIAFRVPSDGAGPPEATAVLQFTEAVDPMVIGRTFTQADFEDAKTQGISYQRAAGFDGKDWAFYQPSPQTLIVSTEPQFLAAIQRGEAAGQVSERLARDDQQQDFVLALSMKGQEALISRMQNMARQGMAPPQLAALGDLPQKLDGITITAGLSSENLLSLHIDARDAASAEEIDQQVESTRQMLTSMHQQNRQQFAGLPQLAEMADTIVNGITATRSGNTVSVTVPNPGDVAAMVAALQPAVERARFTARLAQQANTLKMVGLATLNYHDTFGAFPPGGHPEARDENGNLKNSWRVHLLPYIERMDIFNQLDLKQPWDSEQNKSVLESAENPYLLTPDDEPTSKTRIRMFSGKGTLLDGAEKIRMARVTDGLSNTILAVVVAPDKAVTWYEPGNEIPIDSEDLIGELGAPGPKGYMVVMCDGAVRYLDLDISVDDLRALITISGNEIIDF